MTQPELQSFLEKYDTIKCHLDGECAYFRNENLPWYANNQDNCTRITKKVFGKLTPEDLLHEINRGLEIEHITRITGYFTKVSQWNKGKRGELRDRTRAGKL